jgi:hypothetical protein
MTTSFEVAAVCRESTELSLGSMDIALMFGHSERVPEPDLTIDTP